MRIEMITKQMSYHWAMRAMLLVYECQHMSHLAHLWISNIQNMRELDCDFICDTNYMLAFNAYIINLIDVHLLYNQTHMCES